VLGVAEPLDPMRQIGDLLKAAREMADALSDMSNYKLPEPPKPKIQLATPDVSAESRKGDLIKAAQAWSSALSGLNLSLDQ